MADNRVYPRGREHDVQCRLLMRAEQYRNASTGCEFTNPCEACPVKIALDKNPMHTLKSLRKAVAEIIANKQK